MIECGWCGVPTSTPDRCQSCRHEDPAKPWVQRGQEPPSVTSTPGRPALDEHAIRARYAEARAALGVAATVEAIAERLDRSPRTVREWRKRYGLQ